MRYTAPEWLTQEFLHSKFDYDENEGVLYWKGTPDAAGGLNKQGYVTIGLNDKRFKAHRLVWLYVYGEYPDCDIKHLNDLGSDNRVCNLCKNTESLKIKKTYGFSFKDKINGINLVIKNTGSREELRFKVKELIKILEKELI